MKRLIFVLFSLFLIGLVSGQFCSSPPSLPVIYSGEILYDGEIIGDDYDIVAYLNGYGSLGVVNDGDYEIDVSSCGGSSSGTISFVINCVEANEHPEYNGADDWGKVFELDLTFDEIPSSENSCGNGVKDAGEVCDKNDFGVLTCSNYGFDSGSLKCSGSCINIYISGCYMGSSDNGGDNNNGGGGGGGGGGNSDDEDNIIDLYSEDGDNIKENNQEIIIAEQKTSGITGSVIGFVKSGKGVVTFGFGVLVVIAGILVLVKRGKETLRKK